MYVRVVIHCNPEKLLLRSGIIACNNMDVNVYQKAITSACAKSN
jgi:hypothetical protein